VVVGESASSVHICRSAQAGDVSEPTSEPLDLVTARLMVGELSPEELPAIAAQALADGLDSPALREAAGVSALDPREARDAFIRAMNELGVTIPDQTAAMWRLVHLSLFRIASGELEPVDAQHRLAAAWGELGHR
jgi:hypothetical protein